MRCPNAALGYTVFTGQRGLARPSKSARLRDRAQPSDTVRVRYPHFAGLCYKRCAVEQGVQRVGGSELRGEVVAQAHDTPGRIADAAELERRVRSDPNGEPLAPAPAAHEDASRFCPVCSQRLESRRCKLICNVCGYYMSCADYY